jgi:3-isopropylmalate dehydrogenase
LSKYRIAYIEGDGVGPELSRATFTVLNALQEEFRFNLGVRLVPAGDSCLLEKGTALPENSIRTIMKSDACLKAPVGESAMEVIVRLRQELDLYANIRPVKNLPGVESIARDVDFIIVRENTEDLYRGIEFEIPDGMVALRMITRRASKRIAEYAFNLASQRRRKVVAIHKSNVLRRSDGLFAQVCRDVGKTHPDVALTNMYVDAAAMNIIRSPQDFDVIVTTNLYGDILSDEAAQLVGGVGLAASANIGERFALFEPVHGAAPDIANRGIANPIAMLLAAAMMLEWLGTSRGDKVCRSAAQSLRGAVDRALRKGIKTPDLGGRYKTLEMADFVANEIRAKPKVNVPADHPSTKA